MYLTELPNTWRKTCQNERRIQNQHLQEINTLPSVTDRTNRKKKKSIRIKETQNTVTTLTCMKVKVAQLCPTLCNPMDYTVHGILQARIVEWVAFPFSRGSSQPRD